MAFASGARIGISDAESAALLSGKEILRNYEHNTSKSRLMIVSTVMLTLLLACSVFVALGVVAWRVNSELVSVRASLAPHSEEVIHSALEMINSTKATLENVKGVSIHGNELATAAAPSLTQVVGNGANLTTQLVNLLKHPVIRLSLDGS